MYFYNLQHYNEHYNTYRQVSGYLVIKLHLGTVHLIFLLPYKCFFMIFNFYFIAINLVINKVLFIIMATIMISIAVMSDAAITACI